VREKVLAVLRPFGLTKRFGLLPLLLLWAQEGLSKLLYPIQTVVAQLRSGVSESELRGERQVAYHTSKALLQYTKVQLLLLVGELRQRTRPGHVSQPRPPGLRVLGD
jgi:hypothetical protein